jgi:L-histidine N-alpha-methyltransferase
VTAAFNLNVLSAINTEFNADFDLDQFEHVVVFDEENSWIEMRLRSRRAQRVTVRTLDLTLDFAEGEEILTEISTKFRSEMVDDELVAAGFSVEGCYTDPDRDFRVTLARPKG